MGRKKMRSFKALRKEAWAMFSSYIKIRDKHTCITCGRVAYGMDMHAGHFLHYNQFDFDEIIVNGQCRTCNYSMSHDSTLPHKYRNTLEKKYGKELIDSYIARKREIRKFTRCELAEIIEKYQGKIALMMTDNLTEPVLLDGGER